VKKKKDLEALIITIGERNYPNEELIKGIKSLKPVKLKQVIEHVSTVGYLTEDQEQVLHNVFQ